MKHYASVIIGHISHDEEEMFRVYEMGRDMGQRKLKEIQQFWNCPV